MVTLRKYSHHFVVLTNDRKIIQPILDFYRNHLSTFKFGRSGARGPKEIDKTFASRNMERTHYRMHISCYNEFIRYMARRGISESIWKVEVVPMYDPVKVEMKCIFPHPLRPKQVEIKDFIMDGYPEHPKPIRVIPLQMGGGKTLIALYCAALMGVRTMVVVSKRYRDNWYSNLCGEEAKLDLEEKDVLVIASHNDLVRAIRKARTSYERFDYKVILIHKSTISNFIKSFVRGEERFKEYGIKVEELYSVFGIGVVIPDEAHEELHANANQDLHRHCPMVIDLSATLDFDDPKLDEMCRMIYPIADRYNGGEWSRYIDVRALMFGLKLPTKLRWRQYKDGPYNQPEFEKSVFKDKQKRAYYIEMLINFVRHYFIDVAEKGDKLAVYASTIPMCTELADNLQERYPELTVNRYVGEDDYENLMNSDVIVTTPGSAGTGVDIKGLRRVIMTLALKSSQRNYQLAGRLRELLDVDSQGVVKDVVFYYYVCTDIPQHLDYHQFKREKFRGRMKSHEEIHTGYLL